MLRTCLRPTPRQRSDPGDGLAETSPSQISEIIAATSLRRALDSGIDATIADERSRAVSRISSERLFFNRASFPPDPHHRCAG